MTESNFDNINELRKQNLKFQLAMGVANEGYWEWNIPDKTLFFDSNSARIMNYPEEEILVGIDDMLQTVDNRDLEDFSKVLGIVVQGIEKQFEYSFRTVDYNMKPVWFKIVGKVFDTNEDGKPIHVIGIIRDISRSKQEEKLILERDEKLRLLANYSSDVIIYYENFKKKFVSPSVHRVLGYTQEEYLRIETISLLHPEDRNKLPEFLQNSKTQTEVPSTVLTYRQLHKKGYYIWIEAVAKSRTMEDGTKIVAVNSRDITERKKAQLAMEESEKRLNDYIYNAPYGMFVSDNYGNYIDANPAAERLTGYSIDELVKMKISDIIPKEDNQKGMNHFLALQSSDKPVPLEIRFIRKSGEVRYWMVTAVKLSDNKFLAFTHDITDRILAQNALESSESQLRDIFENSTNMFYSHDANHKIIYLSPQAEEILGYTPEEALVNWTTLVTDNPINEIGYKNTVRALETGIKQPPYELEVFKKNGDIIWLEVREAPKVNENGEVVIIGSATDVTDRKKAELELRESEALLTEVSKIAKVGGWEMDMLHGGKAVWTKGTYDIVEIDCGEPVPGFDEHISFYLPEYREYVTEKMNNLVTKYEEMEYEAQFLTQMGNLKWGRAKGRAVIKDGICVKILGTFQDITAEKWAEEKLQSERERLAVTLRSIGDGVITTDTHGKITLMNKVAEELTGWTHEEAIDQPLESILNLVHEHTYEKHPNPIERVLKTGAIVELQNHTILVSKDGKERMIADSGAPIRDKYSKIIGVVLVFRDITEKHKLEQAIQQATKLESLGVLAAGIAHDFNNLLGGVFGYIDIARTFTDNPQLIEYLDSSMEALDRARALTGQLLTFSKGGEPITSVTSLFPFVKDTVEFILSGSNIKCKYYIDPELWSCDIDKNQIGQVVDNIVINAREAMSDRGEIIVSAQNREIENDAIPNLSSGKYVQLIFKDFGKGIPKEIIGKVFDPFFTTKNLGNGLGLATCYSIIEKHDGIIEIDSEVGEGTEVRIFIPAYARKINEKNGYMKKIHKGEGKILILDDELIIRKMLTTMLISFGYKVISKEEGSEALFYYREEIAKGTKFKALIFDLTIQGGLGGRDIIRDIREIDQNIPIFVASGYSGDPIIANPTNYGFTASIVKPFKINELATVLDKHLNNRV